MKYFETQLKSDTHYKEFGKYAINLKMLYNNILSVRYKKSYAPTKIKKTEISDDLVEVILYILDTAKIDYEKVKELNSKENDLFKDLMMNSGLYDKLKYNYNNTRENISDIIEEYEILKGQIEAENNNPELIKRVKLVLKKLSNYGKISDEEYREIVDDL